MEKLYKEGEEIKEAVKVGDVIEIKNGIFIKVKSIETITEEDLAGTKKTNVYLKGEVVSNGRG
jgi:hypothetical protein